MSSPTSTVTERQVARMTKLIARREDVPNFARAEIWPLKICNKCGWYHGLTTHDTTEVCMVVWDMEQPDSLVLGQDGQFYSRWGVAVPRDKSPSIYHRRELAEIDPVERQAVQGVLELMFGTPDL